MSFSPSVLLSSSPSLDYLVTPLPTAEGEDEDEDTTPPSESNVQQMGSISQAGSMYYTPDDTLEKLSEVK